MFVCLALVSACSTPRQQTTLPSYQQNLMAKCPRQLPTLSDGEAGTVLTTMKQWAGQYHDCATRHNGLVDAIRAAE